MRNRQIGPRSLINRFIHNESASSLLLGLSALVAMLLANSNFAPAYFQFLELKIAGLSIHHWINDALMAIFFFVVGLEIKREIVAGNLSTLRKASLPVAAAIGGMVVPALIYFVFNVEGEAARGWAIPMATDIAFALGVLTLFGRRVPLSLKVFLLALAIVDDLGAVLVIAFFYTEQINTLGLVAASVAISAVVALRALGVGRYFAYIPVGAVLWVSILASGVHATVAGIILGFLTPFSYRTGNNIQDDYSPLNDLIDFLHPWVGFVIMPVFALANAGIPLSGIDFSSFANDPVSVGIAAGLLIGKPVGILMSALIAVKLRIAHLPADLSWASLFGAASLAGIGFTMSIFITNLALSDQLAINAKTAILAASLVSAILGWLILKVSLPEDNLTP